MIEPALQEAEIRRSTARPTSDLTAYDLYLRARPLMRGWGKEACAPGLDLLREALARDPNDGPALVGAAWCASQLVTGGWAEDPETDRREALDLVRRAVKAAPTIPRCSYGPPALSISSERTSVARWRCLTTRLPSIRSNAFGWFWQRFETVRGIDRNGDRALRKVIAARPVYAAAAFL